MSKNISRISSSLLTIALSLILLTGCQQSIDYQSRLAREQMPLIIGASVLFLCVLILVVILYAKSRRSSKHLENLVRERTDELELQSKNLTTQTATLTTLFDSIPDIIFIKDLDLRYIQFNQALADHFGLSKEEILGKHDSEILTTPIEHVEQFNVVDRRVIASGQVSIAEEMTLRSDGTPVFFETKKVPMKVDGVTIGVMGIARDISRRRELEKELASNFEYAMKLRNEAEAANRVKSEFLAKMSHEIRTPMNSIIGFSELALDNNNPQRSKGYFTKILQNAEWLLQIINDILDISKVESGSFELEKIPFSLQDVFESCQSTVLPSAIEKGLELQFYAEAVPGRVLLGDSLRLQQVLVNILSNAIKFTSSGEIKALAETINKTDESITFRFSVRDGGIGMTAEQIERIYFPFLQADAGTTRKYGGTGLGLAITKNIVEAMGGKLHVDSTPDIGSEFSFELTFDTINDADIDAFEDIEVYQELEKPTLKGDVLICDDNPMNRQVICEHLLRVGLKPFVAENGKVGVDRVKERIQSADSENPRGQFCLIFMDIHMPVMDGIEATKKILELNTGVPIIAMTANIMSHDINIYKDKGMVDHLGKPFSSQDLWHILVKYLTQVEPGE